MFLLLVSKYFAFFTLSFLFLSICYTQSTNSCSKTNAITQLHINNEQITQKLSLNNPTGVSTQDIDEWILNSLLTFENWIPMFTYLCWPELLTHHNLVCLDPKYSKRTNLYVGKDLFETDAIFPETNVTTASEPLVPKTSFSYNQSKLEQQQLQQYLNNQQHSRTNCSLMDFLFSIRHYHPAVGFSTWNKQYSHMSRRPLTYAQLFNQLKNEANKKATIRNAYAEKGLEGGKKYVSSFNDAESRKIEKKYQRKYSLTSHQSIGILGVGVIIFCLISFLLYLSYIASENVLFNIFNIYQHFASLIKNPTCFKEDRFFFLEGFRVASMVWVFIGHSVLYWIGFLPFDDAVKEFVSATKNPSNYPIVAAVFAVDNFFYVSGFLAGYHFYGMFCTLKLKNKEKNNNKLFFQRFRSLVFVFISLIIQRYIRLMAAALVLLFGYMALNFTKMTLPTGSRYLQATNMACAENIVPILSLSNNVSDGEFINECFGWTWYLANEFQFFLIGLCITCVAADYSARVYLSILSSLIVTSIYFTSLTAYKYRLSITVATLEYGWKYVGKFIHGRKFFPLHPIMDYFYVKPWVRIGPYLVGLVVGISLAQCKTSTQLKQQGKRNNSVPASCFSKKDYHESFCGDNEKAFHGADKDSDTFLTKGSSSPKQEMIKMDSHLVNKELKQNELEALENSIINEQRSSDEENTIHVESVNVTRSSSLFKQIFQKKRYYLLKCRSATTDKSTSVQSKTDRLMISSNESSPTAFPEATISMSGSGIEASTHSLHPSSTMPCLSESLMDKSASTTPRSECYSEVQRIISKSSFPCVDMNCYVNEDGKKKYSNVEPCSKVFKQRKQEKKMNTSKGRQEESVISDQGSLIKKGSNSCNDKKQKKMEEVKYEDLFLNTDDLRTTIPSVSAHSFSPSSCSSFSLSPTFSGSVETKTVSAEAFRIKTKNNQYAETKVVLERSEVATNSVIFDTDCLPWPYTTILKHYALSLFVVSTAIPIVLVLYAHFVSRNPTIPFGKKLDALYMGAQRTLWGMSMGGWTLLIVFHDKESFQQKWWLQRVIAWLKKLTSHKLWMPISRLSYCIYLCHPIVLFWFYGMGLGPTTFDRGKLLFCFLTSFFITLIAATLLYILVESPVKLLVRLAAEPRHTNSVLTKKSCDVSTGTEKSLST